MKGAFYVYQNQLSRKQLYSYIFFFCLFIFITVLTYHFLFTQIKDVDFSTIHLFTPWQLIALTALSLCFVLLDAFRLYFILRLFGETTSLGVLIMASFVYAFLCNITPLIIGGGFIIIYFLMREGIPFGKAAAAAYLRPLFSSMFNMITVPISLVILRTHLQFRSIKFFWLLLCIFIFVITVLVKFVQHLDKFYPSMRGFFMVFVRLRLISRDKARLYDQRAKKQIGLFTEYFHIIRRRSFIHSFFVILSTIFYFVALYSFSFVMVRFLGHYVKPSLIFAYENIVNFVMYFGVTPGGSGVAEGGYMYLFNRQIEDPVALSSMTFYWRFFTAFLVSIIGFFLLMVHVIKEYLQVFPSKQ